MEICYILPSYHILHDLGYLQWHIIVSHTMLVFSGSKYILEHGRYIRTSVKLVGEGRWANNGNEIVLSQNTFYNFTNYSKMIEEGVILFLDNWNIGFSVLPGQRLPRTVSLLRGNRRGAARRRPAVWPGQSRDTPHSQLAPGQQTRGRSAPPGRLTRSITWHVSARPVHQLTDHSTYSRIEPISGILYKWTRLEGGSTAWVGAPGHTCLGNCND